jgi:predicted Zn-ribbon and HTH transcriptional regulator
VSQFCHDIDLVVSAAVKTGDDVLRMVMGCKNCGSHFTHDEMVRLTPPEHSWPLTDTGKRIRDENKSANLDQSQCPTCGCRTLRRATFRGTSV